MIETSARLLQLLSLLQVRREWTGAALAERMEVTERTVRRDIDKLRSLGYPINASPGVAGGYQLGAGAALPPLLLDDQEALAVALGLSAVTAAPVSGIGESSIRALAKLEQVLPTRLRNRFSALKNSVTRIAGPADAVDPSLLSQISTLITEQRAMSFEYQTHDGGTSHRIVEPHRLVDSGQRWYLVAWDVNREDWRTFRVDRVLGKLTERQKFTPKPPPAKDLAKYVHQAITRSPYRYDLKFRIKAPASKVADWFSLATAQIEQDGEWSIVSMGWDNLNTPLADLAGTGLDFEILEPAELKEAASVMAERLSRAAK